MVESFEKMVKVCVANKKNRLMNVIASHPNVGNEKLSYGKLCVIELLTHRGLIKIKFASI